MISFVSTDVDPNTNSYTQKPKASSDFSICGQVLKRSRTWRKNPIRRTGVSQQQLGADATVKNPTQNIAYMRSQMIKYLIRTSVISPSAPCTLISILVSRNYRMAEVAGTSGDCLVQPSSAQAGSE